MDKLVDSNEGRITLTGVGPCCPAPVSILIIFATNARFFLARCIKMEALSPTTCWSPGDTAFITDGEYAGMYARIWEIRIAENKALISLCVFRENVPFEIELSLLQRPPSSKGVVFRAAFWSLLTVMAGPVLLLVFLLVVDFLQERNLAQVYSLDVVALVWSWPFYVSAIGAIYVGFRVLTDHDPQK